MCVLNKYLIQYQTISGLWILAKDEENKPKIWYDLVEALQAKEDLQFKQKYLIYRLIRVNDTVEIIE